jgi:hypothetical protein
MSQTSPTWYSFSATHNVHQGFPAVMSDGRIYASYQPDAVVNQYIINKEGISSNFQYRRYLQKNANTIMKENTMEASNETGLIPYRVNAYNNLSGGGERTMYSPNTPFMYNSVTDTRNPNYIGVNNSILKAKYLTREQQQARMMAPVVVVATNSTSS